MGKEVKVAMVGIGAMGKLIARAVLDRRLQIVGAFDSDEKIVGKDLGEVIGIEKRLGISIDSDLQNLQDTKANIALYATVARLKEYLPQILPAMEAHMDIISTNEELSYPWHLPEAVEIDEQAKRLDVTVFGTGVNPGFTVDVLPVVLTSLCHEVDKVEVKRVVDLSPYSLRDMMMWGIGLSPEEWWKLKRDGEVGQIGMACSVHYIADCLGVRLDNITEELRPFTGKVRRKGLYVTVEPGKVVKFEQKVCGKSNGEEFVSFTMIGDLDPQAERTYEPGVFIQIAGKPNIRVELQGTTLGEEGALATTGRIVNMIPIVMAAPAGLITQDMLPIGSCNVHIPPLGRMI
jgi:4-hydroxy-tetrahydrodipicolinate reductase